MDHSTLHSLFGLFSGGARQPEERAAPKTEVICPEVLSGAVSTIVEAVEDLDLNRFNSIVQAINIVQSKLGSSSPCLGETFDYSLNLSKCGTGRLVLGDKE